MTVDGKSARIGGLHVSATWYFSLTFTIDESCPPQWKSRSADGVKHCYYISTELTTWDKARAKCGLLTSGADLVKIQTSQETYFLKCRSKYKPPTSGIKSVNGL